MHEFNSAPPVSQDEIAAYTAILHTMSIYHMALDAGDFEAFGASFTDDGIFETTNGSKLIGREEICATFAKRREERISGHDQSSIFQRHHLTSRLIEMKTQDTAFAFSYAMLTSEIGLDHFVTYRDTFTKVGNRWLLARRRSSVDWISENSRFRSGIGSRHAS